MFKLLNQIIITSIPLVPKYFVSLFANKYVAGTTINDCLNTVEKINSQKLKATVDILGEHTKDKIEAVQITDEYCSILNEINKRDLDCNISIKPSHIGTDIDLDLYLKNLNKIHASAVKFKNFVRIDMEDSSLTDSTLDSYHAISNPNIGIVLQAYLHRTEADLDKLKGSSNIRLCKGIYNESEKISFKNRDDINNNYLRLLKKAFDKKIFTGIATHDPLLIEKSLEIIKQNNINKSMFEFQMLHGVPMNRHIKNILKCGYNVRIYVPFGQNWYDYSIRRIKENPNISKYIIQNLFKK